MDRLFNNADSFAMVFDDAWRKLAHNQEFKQLTIEEKITKLFESNMADHPFLIDDPEQALKVAQFRVRLLGLT
jgi:hypothetical protein